ncbi:MAG: hypothetical protein SF053_02125 [Bacteroidia bacterium]|nr:hypothetical protein [Bacteroidia bacterium]
MLTPFLPGAIKQIRVRVTADKLARFETGLVHPVYSTFALGQDAEWACRQFVLEMLEPGEEGVGTFLTIYHQRPALEGEEVEITATLDRVTGREVVCTWVARVGTRQLAHGEQGQQIINRARFEALLASLREDPQT